MGECNTILCRIVLHSPIEMFQTWTSYLPLKGGHISQGKVLIKLSYLDIVMPLFQHRIFTENQVPLAKRQHPRTVLWSNSLPNGGILD